MSIIVYLQIWVSKKKASIKMLSKQQGAVHIRILIRKCIASGIILLDQNLILLHIHTLLYDS